MKASSFKGVPGKMEFESQSEEVLNSKKYFIMWDNGAASPLESNTIQETGLKLNDSVTSGELSGTIMLWGPQMDIQLTGYLKLKKTDKPNPLLKKHKTLPIGNIVGEISKEEQLQEHLFGTKNAIIEAAGGRRVNALEMFRDIFPEGSLERQGHPEDCKPNLIIYRKKGASSTHEMVFDELETLQRYAVSTEEFVTTNGIAYFGKTNTAKMASAMYALILDIDYLTKKEYLETLIYEYSNNIIPVPTYIVNSGNGVHLYFVFEDPIPMTPSMQSTMRILKDSLVSIIWNQYVSAHPEERIKQHQGIHQTFRIPGTKTKMGNGRIVAAYHIGEKVSVEYLDSFVSDNIKFNFRSKDKERIPLAEAKKRYPEWYQRVIVEGRPCTGHWKSDKGLYAWWLKTIRDNATFGHRYFCVMVLSIFAQKCSIPYEQLREDAISLIPRFSALSFSEPFTLEDVNAALQVYHQNYYRTPRKQIERWTGIAIPHNLRKGRPQATHLKLARANESILRPDWREGNGRKPAQSIVLQWQAKHPNEGKQACCNDTKLSWPTVDKWWQPQQKKITAAQVAISNWKEDHPFGTRSECAADTGLSRPTVKKYWKEPNT